MVEFYADCSQITQLLSNRTRFIFLEMLTRFNVNINDLLTTVSLIGSSSVLKSGWPGCEVFLRAEGTDMSPSRE